MTTAFKIPFKAALGALTLAGCLAAPAAHADSTQYLALTLPAGTTTQTATFSDVVGYAGSFTDDYVFASPPPVSLASFTGTAGSGISFSSVSLLTYGTLAANSLGGSFSAAGFSESTLVALQSGAYVLEIKGVSSSATASYSGTISAALVTAAVPEPASWALMLLGIGFTGSALRRRSAVL